MADQIGIYDILLAITLVGAAWKALFGRDAFTSTAFFVVYGLLMAVAWVQLRAIDVALAEACVGAGLTGALLIGAIRQFEKNPSVHIFKKSLPLKICVSLFCTLLFIGLVASLVEMQNLSSPIPNLVRQNLANSGSEHPVTAMLLNYRAFDTWLELGVLLLASIAAIAIHRVYDQVEIPKKVTSWQFQPRIIAQTMFPVLIVVGGAILWFGSWAPGGAFQAGALIGAAGILLQISGERSALKLGSLRTRFVLSLGYLTFLCVAAFTFLMGRNILEYSAPLAGLLILIVEVAATFSIALTLNVMYACSHPWEAKK